MQARFAKPMAALAISAAVVVGTMGVSAASVDAKGTKKQYCKSALKIGSNITPSFNPKGLPKKDAAKLEKSFTKLAKLAPTTSLRKSTLTMAHFFGRIADGDSAKELAKDAGAYGKASAKWATYLATQCVSVSIPDITLPDITLP